MKIIISVQAKRSSSRGLVHYIAHSKTDPQKESGIRALFNEYSDSATVKRSNEFLQTGVSKKRPSNEDLHHLVISIKNEDFDRLGSGERERRSSLRQITRSAMKSFKTEIGAEKLAWSAGIHRNTNNPHVHIAISKVYFEKNLEKKSLLKIPTSLLPHYKKENGQKVFIQGILITEATKKLNDILLGQHKDREDRSQHQKRESVDASYDKDEEIERKRKILASALLAKHYLENSQKSLDSLTHHGDKMRFTITDNITDKIRKMSLFDLERRAERSAAHKIKTIKLTDPIKKDELKKELIKSELRVNSNGIKGIKSILGELRMKETKNLKKREIDHEKISPIAEAIRKEYKTKDMKLPAPLLTREELEILQASGFEKKDVRMINYLERVRSELASEHGVPTRTRKEIARLKAGKIVSHLKVLILKKQLKEFPYKKQNFPVAINGEKWSLARVDSILQNETTGRLKIIRNRRKAIGEEKEKDRAHFAAVKDNILEELDAKHEQLVSDLKGEKSVGETFENIYKNDTNPEKETIAEKYSATELAVIEELSFKLNDIDRYRDNWDLQKNLLDDRNIKPSTKIANKILQRALARKIMSEIKLNRAKEEIEQFRKLHMFQKFEVENAKTGEHQLKSLQDVAVSRRGSLLDQTLEYFIENRDIRRTRHKLEKIVWNHYSELKDNLKSAKAFYTDAVQETQYLTLPAANEVPLLTPKELVDIEIRMNSTTDNSEAEKLKIILDLADHADAKNLSTSLNSYASEGKEQETAKMEKPEHAQTR